MWILGDPPVPALEAIHSVPADRAPQRARHYRSSSYHHDGTIGSCCRLLGLSRVVAHGAQCPSPIPVRSELLVGKHAHEDDCAHNCNIEGGREAGRPKDLAATKIEVRCNVGARPVRTARRERTMSERVAVGGLQNTFGSRPIMSRMRRSCVMSVLSRRPLSSRRAGQ
jgi:hypothetical protein